MARSAREKYLIIGVAAVVGLFALDHYAISPYFTAREAIGKEREVAIEKINQNLHLFREEREMRRLWGEMAHHFSGLYLSFETDLGEDIVIESRPRLEGRQMVMMIAPKKKT